MSLNRSRGIVNPKLKRKLWVNKLRFVIAMWLLSRLVILVVMQLAAPLLPFPPTNFNEPLPLNFVPNFVPKIGQELFIHWDGAWYRKIATLGYDYADDQQWHSVAFFPLFPLISRGVMCLGLPFEVAGILVNNLALLGALFLLYCWVQERYSIREARWVVAALVWCPFSLYGTVIYTEGLFLLLTTASLRAFDNHQHGQAAVWGAMATATRAVGVALIPAFLLVAWREKRPAIAYAAALASSGGILLFSIYCAVRFGDALAFVHVQRAWQHLSWLDIFNQAFCCFDAESLTKIVMLLGGSFLLWHLRSKLPQVVIIYGFCSFALLLKSGATSSFHRYVYGIVSVSLALGILLACYPRWGYAIIGLFTILLINYTVRFAWWQWVA